MVGEFGFITTEGMRSVIDAILQEQAIAGGLIWSLRFHDQDGGFYWHHEPWGSDFFKAYHWPGGPGGEAYDEARFMRLVRDKAYAIQGCPAPELSVPAAPELITVGDGGLVSWRGSIGASGYDLQRADQRQGPWQTIAYHIPEDATQYHPGAVDETATPDKTYFYQLIACNQSGASPPSRVFGPITIRSLTLVDEFWNLSRTYRRDGKLELKSNDARNFKEDCHRVAGTSGAWLSYHVPGNIITVRVYSFEDQGEPALLFRGGHAGGQGQPFRAATQDFYAGKDMYNFRPPRLYTLEALTEKLSDVVIEFTKEAQIGRLEIEYR